MDVIGLCPERGGTIGPLSNERRSVMLYAAIDIHKHAFQAAVLDPDSGEVVEHGKRAFHALRELELHAA